MRPFKKVFPIRCSKFLEAFRRDGRFRLGDVQKPCLSQRPFEGFLTPMDTEGRDGWVHMKFEFITVAFFDRGGPMIGTSIFKGSGS